MTAARASSTSPHGPRARFLALALVLARSPALADDDPPASPPPSDPPPPADDDLARARELFQRGELAAARALLIRAYERTQRPALLFALGQVELNLGNPQAALDYYEKFIATGPSDDEVSLAQQAIGAARMQLSLKTQPPPPPPPSPPQRRHRPPRWDANDTRIALFGGIAIAAGGGLIYYARDLATDQTGTLSEYGARIDRARLWQWTGIGVASAGALAIGAAILRWRTSGGFEVIATPTAGGGAAATLGRRW
jgi:tetratricopeptide (TPR) repeat protein